MWKIIEQSRMEIVEYVVIAQPVEANEAHQARTLRIEIYRECTPRKDGNDYWALYYEKIEIGPTPTEIVWASRDCGWVREKTADDALQTALAMVTSDCW